ncbi:MAG: Rdx family protein [Phycisphaerae bacterium]|nr:Rdx family protein [Phycisphaerae bacterium]
MEAKFGKENLRAETIVGSKGVFDVVVNGDLIYSKHQTGTFPRLGEIPSILQMKGLAP